MRLIQRRVYALIFLSVFVVSQTACPSTPTTREVKSKLDSAANYLHAGARLNRELFQANVTTIETRRTVAKHINEVNGYLKLVVEKARDLKPCEAGDTQCGIDFGLTKGDLLAKLNTALTALQGFRSGNERIDSTLALAVPLIQQAIALIQVVKELK